MPKKKSRINWTETFTKVPSKIFLKSLNYSFVPFSELIWIFIYVLAAQTSAGQAGSKFKTVCQRVWKNNSNDSRDVEKIWLLYNIPSFILTKMMVGETKFLFLPRKSHVEISKSLRCRIYTIVIVIYRLEVEVRACSQHPFAQIKCRNEAVFWANFGDTSHTHKHFILCT